MAASPVALLAAVPVERAECSGVPGPPSLVRASQSREEGVGEGRHSPAHDARRGPRSVRPASGVHWGRFRGSYLPALAIRGEGGAGEGCARGARCAP